MVNVKAGWSVAADAVGASVGAAATATVGSAACGAVVAGAVVTGAGDEQALTSIARAKSKDKIIFLVFIIFS
jgi:uncharacterized membrane protein